MTKKVPYTCPRCGYNTPKKSNMRLHLYETKKACPTVKNKIELTPEIKEDVIENRIHLIKDEVKIINNTINNNQVIYNFIANMDTMEKLNRMTDYYKVETIDFEDRIESCYSRDIKRLENDSFKYAYKLEESNFLSIIDKLTKVIRGENREQFLEEISVIYDSKNKRIKVYSGKWEEYLVNNGVKHLIHTIVDYYLAPYETYLIRKLTKAGVTLYDTSTCMESIKEYYRFIASFEIEPICKGKTDAELLQREDDMSEDDDSIARRFFAIYSHEYNGITNAKRNSVQKEVLDIIKTNSKCNITQLDKDIIALIKIDPEFNRNLINAVAV